MRKLKKDRIIAVVASLIVGAMIALVCCMPFVKYGCDENIPQYCERITK